MNDSQPRWWDQAVIYQVYPRSFQDSDGDGIGDLAGIESRLDHLVWLGVDALWLSPIYPSPLADMGYDVADHCAVAPELGDMGDFDRLVARAHELGLKLLLDFVPSHTSIEHPWFREHPEYYVWADEAPNNWVAAFGGPAWTLDEETGRYYLHSFYPEQPDLDWRVPEVREAMGDVIRFWTARGVDGFRADALQQLMKDPGLRDDPPATTPYPLPLGDDYGRLDHVHSEAGPDIGIALKAMREAAGDAFLVGEVYRPTKDLGPYLEHLDAAFAFELLHSPFDEEHLAEVVAEGQQMGRVAWALSNHDFPRLATRFGEERAARAAEFLLSLPGTVFLYQGDEIGMMDGPGADPPYDRAGRDSCRHPMQWEPEPLGGFTTGEPWLALTDPERRSVAAQRSVEGSSLELHRRLIAARRSDPDE
ncbi:MAG TPA: alpha-amylase family glycosyl hydrolase [Solirubrobacterales bacterium]|nr:alpha-amylase family glycosyl hydrolase [Solirubrobacterales bacterium]